MKKKLKSYLEIANERHCLKKIKDATALLKQKNETRNKIISAIIGVILFWVFVATIIIVGVLIGKH